MAESNDDPAWTSAMRCRESRLFSGGCDVAKTSSPKRPLFFRGRRFPLAFFSRFFPHY
jgi:hypothetical protein